MPQNAFFHELAIFWSAKKRKMQRHFFSTLHPLSPVIFATATVVAFVLLRNSMFNFHCYTQLEATHTQKSARKWCCNPLQLLAWKITKGIYSCKPASLNCPIKLTTGDSLFYCSFHTTAGQWIRWTRTFSSRFCCLKHHNLFSGIPDSECTLLCITKGRTTETLIEHS